MRATYHYETRRPICHVTLCHNVGMNSKHHMEELTQAAARLAVEEGLEFGAAKLQALKRLRLPSRTPLPDNYALEAAVREHLAIFCADTQPAELRALRQLALQWMQKLQEFEPLLGGAVWRGTATRLNDIYLQLFADDSKTVEIALINQQLRYVTDQVKGLHGKKVDVLSLQAFCSELNENIIIHLLINPIESQKGSLLPDAHGNKARGTSAMLQNLLNA